MTVTVENTTAWAERGAQRDGRHGQRAWSPCTPCWPSTAGTFVSLLDPPDDAAEAARTATATGASRCSSATTTVVLSSPIILYDHPEVAPESPGDLYDATEIDEILALRV